MSIEFEFIAVGCGFIIYQNTLYDCKNRICKYKIYKISINDIHDEIIIAAIKYGRDGLI